MFRLANHYTQAHLRGTYNLPLQNFYKKTRLLTEAQEVFVDSEYSQTDPPIAALSDDGFVIVGRNHGKIVAQSYMANGNKNSAEIVVNATYTTNDFIYLDVAALNNGFVVIWAVWHGDNKGPGIFVKGYTANGTQNMPEFQVNTTYPWSRFGSPTVTAFIDGSFIILWTANNAGIIAQCYTARGMRIGAELQVNSDGYFPAMTAFNNSEFIITWDSSRYYEPRVIAQRYTADRITNGAKFQVNTKTSHYQFNPYITALKNDGFAITWSNNEYNNSIANSFLYAQLYSAGGAKIDTEFQINVRTIGWQFVHAIEALNNGGFVVVWTSSSNVFFRYYTEKGKPNGEEIQVDNIRQGQFYPAITVLRDDSVVVTWMSNFGIFAQRFDSNGNKIEFELDYPVPSFQRTLSPTLSPIYQPTQWPTPSPRFLSTYQPTLLPTFLPIYQPNSSSTFHSKTPESKSLSTSEIFNILLASLLALILFRYRRKIYSFIINENTVPEPSAPLESAAMPSANSHNTVTTLSSTIPTEFICTITQDIMQDPVMTADGHSYERIAIQDWFATAHNTSPNTGLLLPSTLLVPNHNLRQLIQDYQQGRRHNEPINTHQILTAQSLIPSAPPVVVSTTPSPSAPAVSLEESNTNQILGGSIFSFFEVALSIDVTIERRAYFYSFFWGTNTNSDIVATPTMRTNATPHE